MNKFAAIFVCVLGGLLGASPIWAQNEPEVKVSVTHLRGGLYMLHGRGGNVVASVGSDGTLIIDDDYPQFASAYDGALSKLGMQGAPHFVLNTHWHGDHTGNNSYWGERGSVIIAHNNVRKRLSTRQDMKARGAVVEPSPGVALPVVTFEQSLALHFNEDDIEMQHFPRGHTDGDSIIFFSKQNVVHMGDHFFNGRFPFVDTDSGGNLKSYVANVKAALGRINDDTIVVPGHGALGNGNKADLEKFYNMLVSTMALVEADLASGMSKEAIIEKGLGEKWASWGKHWIKEAAWISLIADS